MKEDEYLAAAERGPSIERRAAIARTGDDAIGEGICQQRGAVAAAAIDDDHFSAASSQRREALQRRDDDCRFIKYRNDDSQPSHGGNIAGKAAVGQPRLNG